MSSENKLQSEILDWLNSNGVFSFHVNTTGIYDEKNKSYRRPGKFSLKGTSDIIGMLPDGRILAIEVKTKTGRVSMEQTAFINKINTKGLAFVARSLEDVICKIKL